MSVLGREHREAYRFHENVLEDDIGRKPIVVLTWNVLYPHSMVIIMPVSLLVVLLKTVPLRHNSRKPLLCVMLINSRRRVL